MDVFWNDPLHPNFQIGGGRMDTPVTPHLAHTMQDGQGSFEWISVNIPLSFNLSTNL